jgi:hypothetical protein
MEGAMRFENDKRSGEIPNKKSRQFYVVREWMKQVVPDSLVDTYACVWSVQLAGMSCSAAELGRRLRRTEGTIRRHTRELEKLGFWQRQRRGAGGLTLSNRYRFCRLPEMPDDAAREKHVVGDRASPVTDEQGPESADALDRMAQAIGDKMSGKDLKQQASKGIAAGLVSPEMIAALKVASPRDVDGCIRVLHCETQHLVEDEAKALIANALKQFLARAARGGIENPPGLLRAITRSAASSPAEVADSASELANAIRGLDVELGSSRSAFGIRRTARKRARFYRQVCDALGKAPTNVMAVPELDGERGAIIVEMVHLQSKALDALAKNDGMAASEAESRMHVLERELERLIASEKGAAE